MSETQTNTPWAATAPTVPGWTHVRSGKVRDLYIPDGQTQQTADRLLVVASDRISAYDYVLDTTVPDKGAILTQLSQWWFEQISDIVPTHVITDDVPEQVAGRAVICEKLSMYPVECVVRGYLTGSGLADYKKTGAVCGVKLPAGLVEASRLDNPIFTPAAKAEVGDHDENISFDVMAKRIGDDDANQLRQISVELYKRARDIAAKCGIIVADTKFEFGQRPDGTIVLADEVLTPDSSRFWPADEWVEGQVTPSFDKQFVRDWLTSAESGWDKASGTQPPALPSDVVERTRDRYIEAFEKLTGRSFSRL